MGSSRSADWPGKAASAAIALAVGLCLFALLGLSEAQAQSTAVRAELQFSGLHSPTQFAFAPDGRIFMTERLSGHVRFAQNGRVRPQPFKSLPIARGFETGLLGLALHPDFRSQPFVYVYYSTRGRQGVLINRVVRYRDAGGMGVGPVIIVDNIPAAFRHNGGKLAFGPDRKLYVTTGDANVPALAAQFNSLAGKVLRVNPDGSIPSDNPLRGSLIWSRGHRNVFGLAFHPQTGRLFITENGPNRDDEVNIIVKGGHYGWPQVVGVARRGGLADPVATYTPNIAPTGIVFPTGGLMPRSLLNHPLFGDWNTGSLRWLGLGGPTVTRVSIQRVVHRAGSRGVLDLQNGPDGAVWFSTPTTLQRIVRR